MSSEPTLVATLTDLAELGAAPAALLERVGLLEVRADLVGDLEPETLRSRYPGPLLYTLRSRGEWGRFAGSAEERRRRIEWASERYRLVDLELERDLDAIPPTLEPARRLLSWHGSAPALGMLRQRLEAMDAVEAAYRKLVPTAKRAGEELHPLDLLALEARSDIVAFATGEIGQWTRIVAAFLGAPLVYGSLADQPAAPGQPSIRKLIDDFDLPHTYPIERLYGIVGKPVAHSLSPRLHNWAYRQLGIPALFVPFHVESFGDFWLEVVESGIFERLGRPLAGLSVTTPCKGPALAVAEVSSPRAQAVGGANTLTCPKQSWEAETTDPEGVVLPLAWHGVSSDRGEEAAVVGCGGAGLAAAVGLRQAGYRVTLVNRSVERGRDAAKRLQLPFVALKSFDPAAYSVIVQATTLGRATDDPLPFDPQRLAPDATLVELVYGGDTSTPLAAAAAASGLDVIEGREVLLGQAIAQFRLHTGRELPLQGAAELLGLSEVRASAVTESSTQTSNAVASTPEQERAS